MAKTFYFDSVGLLESTIGAGTINGTTYTNAAGEVTNEETINDQSITSGTVSSFVGNESDPEDAIRIDLGSAKSVDFVLVNVNASIGVELQIVSANALDGLGDVSLIDGLLSGWNVDTFTSQSKRYWFLESASGNLTGITEVIIGSKLTFENEPDIGISTQEKFATQINKSYGGSEYAIKKHDPQTTWMLNFSNISQTFKDNLVSLENAVTDYKKFVYHDGSAYNYVRLESSIKFTEVAYERYSASIKLREQLS